MSAKEPGITKEEQELLESIDEDLALPPLPPDFISNVLGLLGIPSSVVEETHEPTNPTPYSEMLEEFYQRGREARAHGNYTLAVGLFRVAAEQGHADAQYSLGQMYFHGVEVRRNDEEAVKWFHLAAEQEHGRALDRLGFMYYEGLGVAKDRILAEKWYSLAAEQSKRRFDEKIRGGNRDADSDNRRATAG